MTEAGQEIWKEFVLKTEDYPELKDACSVLPENLQVFQSIDDVREDPDVANDDVWLLATHSIYESNRDDVKVEFEKIRRRFCPSTIAVSGYSGNSDHMLHVTGEGLEELSSLSHEFWQNRESVFNRERSEPGFMQRTLEWRRDLYNEIGDELEGDETNYGFSIFAYEYAET